MNKEEIKRRLKDKKESINTDVIELNKTLNWAILNNSNDIIDIILRRSRFEVDTQIIKVLHILELVKNNNFKAFKRLYNKVKYDKFSILLYSNSFVLMEHVCLNRDSEYLKILTEIPQIDFSLGENILIKTALEYNLFENVEILLNRPEIKRNKELYDKYKIYIRNNKIKTIKSNL